MATTTTDQQPKPPTVFDHVRSLLSGGMRAEIDDLKKQRQRQDEAIVELRREIEALKEQAMPRRRSVPHSDRRRARRAEARFEGGQS